MNLSYFISVTGSKILALVTLLSLSYFMKPIEFGQFALISTNALFVQLLFGSWITSGANKFISLSSKDEIRDEISIIFLLVIAVVISLSVFSLIYVYLTNVQFDVAMSVLYFACAIIVFDIILAILNGSGNAAQYSQLSLFRACVALVFPVLVAAIGGSGVQVSVASATAVIFSMLTCRPARSIFSAASSLNSLSNGVVRYLSFGFGGALVLGLYILINAPTRNLIAYFEGLDAAGHWALTSDVFYGPLAIAGTVVTLSANRLLHQWPQRLPKQLQDASIPYFQSLLLVSLPYAAIGYFVAADITPLIFSAEISAEVASLAPQICIQNAAILIIYGLCYVAFTKERWNSLYVAISTATLLPLITSAFTLADAVPWFDLTDTMVISTVACAFLIASSYTLLGIIQISLRNLSKIIMLSGFALLVISAIRLIDSSSLMTLFACIVGGIIYFLGAYLFGMLKMEPVASLEG